MTVNKLIVLLDCVVGFNRERHTGTLPFDIAGLIDKGLIEHDDIFEYTTTRKGDDFINLIQNISEMI